MTNEKDFDEIVEIINSFKWTFAKTMKSIPHWYIVKNTRSIEESKKYERLYQYIFDNHYIKYFKGKPYKYVDIEGYSYWIMTDDISESIIINRAKIESRKESIN